MPQPESLIDVFAPVAKRIHKSRVVSSGHICLGAALLTQNSLPLPLTNLTMSPPSACLISGIFALSDGSRDPSTRYRATYLSALNFPDPKEFINISIRAYTGLTDTLYEDGSLVFIVAKAALLAGEDGLLDAIHYVPFGSFSDSEDPPPPVSSTPTAFVAGTVVSVDNSLPASRLITLNTSEYIRDQRRAFHVRFVFLT